jgi:hypothetical protein
MKIYVTKNRVAFCLLAALGLVLASCFQAVDTGETFVEKATAHLRVTNESADESYVLEGLELRNAEGEVEQSWEGLDLAAGDKPWEVHTETSGSCTLWYRVKDTEISGTAIGVYQAEPPVEIALNRSHEFSFRGEDIEITQQDADGDGLPDAWETEHGFNPEDPGDGGTVYVSPLGRDEAPGNGTKTHPYLTLAKAVDKAGRGLLINGVDDSARTVVVLGTLTWANGGNDQLNPENKGRDDSVFYLGKTRNPVTIRGENETNPGTLTAENAGNKRVLYLDSGAGITLRDMVITGGKGSGGGIYASGANLTLGPGTAVKENNKTTAANLNDLVGISGGGIYMERGVLVMEPGSSVSDNMASGGGGLRLAAATLTMNGGTITNNRSTGAGGGLYAADNCTVKMFVGAAINKNEGGTEGTYSGFPGGGVYLSFSVFTMHGGTISENKLKDGYAGGGVYVSDESTMIMEGGEISGNTNTNTLENKMQGTGGGVAVVQKSSFIMENGKIAKNTTAYVGGGLYLAHSGTTFVIRGGTIYGNTTDGNANIAAAANRTDTGHAIHDARPEISNANRAYNATVTAANFPR